jgi:hypothetical protein
MTTKLVVVRIGLAAIATVVLFMLGWWSFGVPRLAGTVAVLSVLLTAVTLAWESRQSASPI